MKTLFSVPVYDEHGNTDLYFGVLLSALQSHADILTVRVKNDPENEQLSKELAATLTLQMDLSLLESSAFLEQGKPQSLNTANPLTLFNRPQSN